MLRPRGPIYALAVSLALSACEEEVPVIEMAFGATDWVWNSNEPASDNIPEFALVISRAAVKCKVKLLGYNGRITDGGEAAYFEGIRHTASTEACLKQEFPQGVFTIIARDEWNRVVKENPGFPIQYDNLDGRQSETQITDTRAPK